jgi:hypothetical protein
VGGMDSDDISKFHFQAHDAFAKAVRRAGHACNDRYSLGRFVSKSLIVDRQPGGHTQHPLLIPSLSAAI